MPKLKFRVVLQFDLLEAKKMPSDVLRSRLRKMLHQAIPKAVHEMCELNYPATTKKVEVIQEWMGK